MPLFLSLFSLSLLVPHVSSPFRLFFHPPFPASILSFSPSFSFSLSSLCLYALSFSPLLLLQPSSSTPPNPFPRCRSSYLRAVRRFRRALPVSCVSTVGRRRLTWFVWPITHSSSSPPSPKRKTASPTDTSSNCVSATRKNERRGSSVSLRRWLCTNEHKRTAFDGFQYSLRFTSVSLFVFLTRLVVGFLTFNQFPCRQTTMFSSFFSFFAGIVGPSFRRGFLSL